MLERICCRDQSPKLSSKLFLVSSSKPTASLITRCMKSRKMGPSIFTRVTSAPSDDFHPISPASECRVHKRTVREGPGPAGTKAGTVRGRRKTAGTSLRAARRHAKAQCERKRQVERRAFVRRVARDEELHRDIDDKGPHHEFAGPNGGAAAKHKGVAQVMWVVAERSQDEQHLQHESLEYGLDVAAVRVLSRGAHGLVSCFRVDLHNEPVAQLGEAATDHTSARTSASGGQVTLTGKDSPCIRRRMR